jgi:hypothetical protein
MEEVVAGRLTRNVGSYLNPLRGLVSVADRSILHEPAFQRMLSLERKRAQRSQKPFLLTLLEMQNELAAEKSRKTLARILAALDSTTRETDVTGWYKEDGVVGVMFTEIAMEDRSSILATIMARVSETLRSHLTAQQFAQVGISFHLYPEARDEKMVPAAVGASLYPDLTAQDEARRLG